MNLHPNKIYHIFNEGNKRQILFHQESDYLLFLEMVENLIVPTAEIIAFSLEPENFQFMLYVDNRVNKQLQVGNLFLDPITNGFRKLLSGYARRFNKRYNKTGSVFRQKTKSKCITDLNNLIGDGIGYYTDCFHHIHQKVVKKGVVNKIEDWKYSSFRYYAGLSDNDGVCNKNLAVQYCNYDPKRFMEDSKCVVSEFLGDFLDGWLNFHSDQEQY